MDYNAALPAFGYPVNWKRGVIERYEWVTKVMAGQTGYEQRQIARLAPRRSVEATVYVTGPQRMALDAYLTTRPAVVANQRGLLYCPIWPQQWIIQEDSNGDVVIPNLSAYEFAVGEAALILDLETMEFVTVEVLDVDYGTNTVSLSPSVLEEYIQNFTLSFDPDTLVTHNFDVNVPGGVVGWTALQGFLQTASWDDRGNIAGSLDTIEPAYTPGEVTLYEGPDTLIHNTTDPIPVELVNTMTGGCSFTCAIRWTGYDPNFSEVRKGRVLVPLRAGRLEGKPRFTKMSARLYEGTVRFNFLEADIVTPTLLGDLGEYQTLPVLDAIEPDTTTDMTVEYERLFYILDNRTSIPEYTEKAENGFQAVQCSYTIEGSEEYERFRSFMYYMQGRARTFWVPTFMQDIDMLEDASSATDITVETCGLAGMIPNAERTHIRVEQIDGTIAYREITEVVDNLDGTETITLGTSLTAAVEDIARISFMTLMRSDQDSVEMRHDTDITGSTTCAVTFKTAHVWPDPLPTLSVFTQVFAETFDPDDLIENPFEIDPPVEVAGWTELKAYLVSGSWDDRGSITGTEVTIEPEYTYGEFTVYDGAEILINVGTDPITGVAENTIAGACSVNVTIKWTGYAP